MDFLSDAVLIDTSAILALNDPKDQYHISAFDFFRTRIDTVQWVVLNSTKHEAFTRARYLLNFDRAISIYDFLSKELIYQIRFKEIDEQETIKLLMKYKDEKLSFHDALCASIMMRLGLYRVFTFDKDFIVFGFDIFPLYKGLI
jgi:predicted nucleic acid-binding protein